MTAIRSNFLRAVIGLDAAVCGALGLAFAGGGAPLADLTGLPLAFTQPLGLFLVGYAALLVWLAVRPTLPRRLVWGLVGFNALWAAESVAILVLGWVQPNMLGEAVILTQAAGAAGVAAMQALALRLVRAPAV
jgi:hypothetical protein